MDFMGAIALVCAMTCVDPILQLRADRARFPSDDVIGEWKDNNSLYQRYLEAKMTTVDLETTNPVERDRRRELIAVEMRENERIGQILMWLHFGGHRDWVIDDSILKWWVGEARKYMTEDEYKYGYIQWGGVPRPWTLDR